jgi:hypothetical protein
MSDNATYYIVAILAGVASAITILRYSTKWVKSKIVQGFHLAKTWERLVESVDKLNDLMEKIFLALQQGDKTMRDLDGRTKVNERDIADLKRDMRFLLERGSGD